jgi:hypothetical protein
LVRRPQRQREVVPKASAGRSSLRRCDGARRVRKPRPDRSQPSCRRRRVSAIAFAGKESSDADDPNDHSVATGIVGSAASRTNALAKCDCTTWSNRTALVADTHRWRCVFGWAVTEPRSSRLRASAFHYGAPR